MGYDEYIYKGKGYVGSYVNNGLGIYQANLTIGAGSTLTLTTGKAGFFTVADKINTYYAVGTFNSTTAVTITSFGDFYLNTVTAAVSVSLHYTHSTATGSTVTSMVFTNNLAAATVFRFDLQYS